ncbi:MAG: ABC transporter permease [Lachnospiraceae bacterium]|nr:ABC transporter permease [Lachnospiraceae bacterium]
MNNENPLRNEIVTQDKKAKKKNVPASAKNKTLLATPYGLWMAAFIIIPLILVLYYGLTDGNGNFTLDNLTLIANPINRKALWLSLKLSVISTVICLLLAYPLALILKSMKLKDNSFIVMIVILPMWMNFLLRTIAWQNILEKNGVINTILEALHLPALNIINTPTAIVLGMVYNFLPFMILPIYNTLAKIDDNVINAARDLGANGWVTFKRVIFPLSMPGVISGITMVFVPSLTTFAISTILGGSKIVLIGNVIEQQFQKLGNWNTGSGLSLVLMVFILVSMTAVAKYDKDSEGTNAW